VVAALPIQVRPIRERHLLFRTSHDTPRKSDAIS
jgi:hypothetical protein